MRRREGEKRAKGFSRWDRFAPMLYAQAAGADPEEAEKKLAEAIAKPAPDMAEGGNRRCAPMNAD